MLKRALELGVMLLGQPAHAPGLGCNHTIAKHHWAVHYKPIQTSFNLLRALQKPIARSGKADKADQEAFTSALATGIRTW